MLQSNDEDFRGIIQSVKIHIFKRGVASHRLRCFVDSHPEISNNRYMYVDGDHSAYFCTE